MKEIASRLLRTLRVERENFVWMDFNDRATGDAFYLVLITTILTFIGIFGIGPIRIFTNVGAFEIFFRFLIDGIIVWLLISGITYAVVRFLFEEEHNFPAILRIVGYAYPTRLLIIFFATYFSSPFLVFLLGTGWLLFIVAKGIVATSSLPLERAMLASAGGVVGAVIVSSILL